MFNIPNLKEKLYIGIKPDTYEYDNDIYYLGTKEERMEEIENEIKVLQQKLIRMDKIKQKQ